MQIVRGLGWYLIRRATKKDVPEIALVAERAFGEKPDSYWAVWGATRAQRVFVAETNRRIIGVVEIEVIRLSNGRHGHIGYIFVDPDFRRKGVATELLKVSEEWFRSKDAIASWALTDPENIATRKLFRKMGYEELTKEQVFEELGETDGWKLLRRMIYWEGDVILRKKLGVAGEDEQSFKS